MLFRPFFNYINNRLRKVCLGDENLLWALRRKIAKELIYAERGTPMHRRRIKALKRKQQNNKCAACHKSLPIHNVVLDRLKAMDGYTLENTRVLCRDCDYRIQKKRGFK